VRPRYPGVKSVDHRTTTREEEGLFKADAEDGVCGWAPQNPAGTSAQNPAGTSGDQVSFSPRHLVIV